MKRFVDLYMYLYVYTHDQFRPRLVLWSTLAISWCSYSYLRKSIKIKSIYLINPKINHSWWKNWLVCNGKIHHLSQVAWFQNRTLVWEWNDLRGLVLSDSKWYLWYIITWFKIILWCWNNERKAMHLKTQ